MADLCPSIYSTGIYRIERNLTLCKSFKLQILRTKSFSRYRIAFYQTNKKRTFDRRKHSIFYQSRNTVPWRSHQLSRAGNISHWRYPFHACNIWMRYPRQNIDSIVSPCHLLLFLEPVPLTPERLTFSYYLFIALSL